MRCGVVIKQSCGTKRLLVRCPVASPFWFRIRRSSTRNVSITNPYSLDGTTTPTNFREFLVVQHETTLQVRNLEQLSTSRRQWCVRCACTWAPDDVAVCPDARIDAPSPVIIRLPSLGFVLVCEQERERKVTNGWGSLLGGVASDKRDKIMKALEKYYQEESERKQDYLAVRKEWRNTALSTDFSGFSTPLAR